MSYIKHHLHQQQQLNDELAAEYTADQLFILNDIADEQEQIMQELMSPMENYDQNNWSPCDWAHDCNCALTNLFTNQQHHRNQTMAVYLNTYSRHMQYGGPEEGGWWYDCGTPLQSILYSNEDYDQWSEKQDWDQLKEIRDKTTYTYTEGRCPKPISNSTGGYTFLPGSDIPDKHIFADDVYTCFEEHFAEQYPQERPTYC